MNFRALQKGEYLYWPFLIALGAFLAAFLVYPVAFMLRRGFGLHGEFTFEYFGLLATNPHLRASLFNSVALATVAVIGWSLVVFPLAVALNRLEFSGRQILSSLLLVPMIMPPFVGAIGLKQLLARFGSVNLFFIHLGWMNPKHPIDWLAAGGFWGVALLQVLSLYPILYLSVSAALANIDPALRDAARNLGAHPGHLFRTITLPLLLPGWFSGAIIVWIWSFTDLGTPLITGFSRVTSVQIFDALNDLNTNPQGFSLIVVVLALSLGLFFVSQRIIGRRSYATLARGPSHGAAVEATTGQRALIWGGAVVLWGGLRGGCGGRGGMGVCVRMWSSRECGFGSRRVPPPPLELDAAATPPHRVAWLIPAPRTPPLLPCSAAAQQVWETTPGFGEEPLLE